MTFSTKSLVFAAALALGTSPAWAFPTAPVKSADTAVIQIAKKSHHEISRDEGTEQHKTRCWVKRDSVREFGYWKC